MYRCMVLLTIAVAALAQDGAVVLGAQPGTTVPPGVPLRVALERHVAIKRVGDPIQGRSVDPIYVFDHLVLPAGCIVRYEGPCLTRAAEPSADQFVTLALPAHSQRESRRLGGRQQPAPEFPDHWARSQTEAI